jgi:hypothetical protein
VYAEKQNSAQKAQLTGFLAQDAESFAQNPTGANAKQVCEQPTRALGSNALTRARAPDSRWAIVSALPYFVESLPCSY